MSIYAYGGRGGGKRKISSILEVGYCLEWVCQRKKTQTLGSSEWKILWQHQKVRSDYLLFQRLCAYLQIMKMISPEEEGAGLETQHLFNLLANSLYALESITEKKASLPKHLGLFLVKLIHYSGLGMDTQTCMATGEPLEAGVIHLYPDQGGFIQAETTGLDNDWDLLHFVRHAQGTLFKDVEELPVISASKLQKLYFYFCYHEGIDPKNLLMAKEY